MSNEPAFPTTHDIRSDSEREFITEPGMTLRDYFAAKAMQGLVSCVDWRPKEFQKDTAEYVYGLADAMLHQRLLKKDRPDYKQLYEKLQRKVSHGCTDATCKECDW